MCRRLRTEGRCEFFRTLGEDFRQDRFQRPVETPERACDPQEA